MDFRSFSKVFGLSVLGLGLGFQSQLAHARDELKIGIVDMQRALQSVDAGKKAKAQLEKEFNAKKKELQNEEAALKKMNDDFTKQAAVLNAEARAKKQGELQDRYLKFQEHTGRSQAEIQQKEHDLTLPIIAKLRSSISEVAKKNAYTHVFDRNSVLYIADDANDLTDQVVKTADSSKSGG